MDVIRSLSKLKEKKVLFVTTKELDYIRNSQEIGSLKDVTDRLWIIGSNGKNYLIRLMSVFVKMVFASYGRYDAIFVGFAPQLILPVFGRRMKGAGCFIVEDFFISLYDTFCHDRKRFKPDSFMGRWLHRLDEKALKMGDEIICDTKAHAGYFAKEFGVSEDRCRVLYIEADKNIYHPMNLNRVDVMRGLFADAIEKEQSSPDLRDKKIILYFGSVLPLQGTDTVLEAMKRLSKDGYICVFVGPANDIDPAIYHKPWLSQPELAKLIDISDICLAGHFAEGIAKARRTIPGKAFIYEAMQKPMILGDNEANREYFTESDTVRFAKMGEPDALAEEVRRLAATL